MTPAEARKIDEQEFAAECATIRKRAYSYVEQRRREARAEIAHWLGRDIPKGNVRQYRVRHVDRQDGRIQPVRGREITVDGVTKSITEWAVELDLAPNTLQVRASRLGSYEAAIKLGAGDQRVHPITYNGETLTIKEWATRLGLSTNALHTRIKKHGVEAAIAMGAVSLRHQAANAGRSYTPGVSSNFRPIKETGAWSVLQETPNITFSDKAENA